MADIEHVSIVPVCFFNLNFDVPSCRRPLNAARTLDLVTSIFKSVLSPVTIFYSISSQTLD